MFRRVSSSVEPSVLISGHPSVPICGEGCPIDETTSRRVVFYGVLLTLGLLGWTAMIRMPGKSYAGPIPRLDASQEAIRDALRRDVDMLAGQIGERNLSRYGALQSAARALEVSLAAAGYAVRLNPYALNGRTVHNIEVELAGSDRPDEIVIVGGHYDSVEGSPGANDNATGVAAVLALARAFAESHPSRTLRFLAFVNEEPPYFQTEAMGSAVYATGCRQRHEKIVAMLSLETIGYYSAARGSQSYPFPFNLFYPSTGNFIGFVGNLASRGLVHEAVGSFRRRARHPSEGVATFPGVPGIGWSDQWAFWREGYPAVMVTDTAPFRYPFYHTPQDTPDKVQYDRLALVVAGLRGVVEDLAGLRPHRLARRKQDTRP